jgi:Uma2 family endonuclease
MALPAAPVDPLDDQEYYPLHEEDDVPETPPHEAQSRYARDAMQAHFPDWFVTGNVCIYWERGNTRDYRAPDLFVVKQPLTEPVTRVYQLWRQPPVAFALEVASRTSFRQDQGPRQQDYQDLVKAAEYCHVDLDHTQLRLWRLGLEGYEPVAPEPNGRLRSQELGLDLAISADAELQIFTLEGERLLTHEEEVERRAQAERHAAEEAQRRAQAERHAVEEAQRRAEAEERLQAAEVRAREADARRADLERQLAELRARLGEG